MIIYFDLDGPILDVSEKYYKVYSDLLIDKNYKVLPKQEYWNLKRNKVSENEILKRTNATAIYDWYQNERVKIIESSHYLKCDQLVPEARNILNLVSASHPLILVTLRSSKDQLCKELEEFDVIRYFKAILNAPGVTSPKWKIKYKLIMNHSGVPEKDSVIIGDTETDILTGQNLGIKTIAVCNGIRSEDILKQFNPDRVINNIGELATLNLA